MRILANSEYPGEITHSTAFHQGLHFYFPETKLDELKRKKYNCIWNIYPVNHRIKWTFPNVYVSNQKH